VLGVDDWAWRRGQRYGTVLVDLERARVVDLLPDREADTLAAWLGEHPGVEIVARDRAGAYATGIRHGAPKAIQVADRWHLLRNCSDALLALVERRQKLLRECAAQAAVIASHSAEAPPLSVPEPEPPPPPPNKAKRRQAEGRARRQTRFEAVAALRRQGKSMRAIRLATGLSRNTLRRWLRAGEAPNWRTGQRPHMADAHADYLRQRWEDGCRNATQLWREVRGRGYAGQVNGLRAWVAEHLRGGSARPRTGSSPAKPVWQVPSPRRTARLLTMEADHIRGDDGAFIKAVLASSAEIAAAADLARRFGTMIKARDLEALAPWLTDAKVGPLATFAAGLERDRAAVEAALTEPWSTGPVEGRINKLKLIKRQMYGRAGLDLLRQRVMHA
jgi:transposase